MRRVSLTSEVVEVVERRFELNGRSLEPTTRFVDDLGADSLAIAELTLALEETFDVDIEDEEIEDLRTVRETVACIERARARRRN
jgi:acyl carrier protein